MAWLVALMIIGFLWNRTEDERCLREACRLLHRLWAALSGNHCKFVMVRNRQWENIETLV